MSALNHAAMCSVPGSAPQLARHSQSGSRDTRASAWLLPAEHGVAIIKLDGTPLIEQNRNTSRVHLEDLLYISLYWLLYGKAPSFIFDQRFSLICSEQSVLDPGKGERVENYCCAADLHLLPYNVASYLVLAKHHLLDRASKHRPPLFRHRAYFHNSRPASGSCPDFVFSWGGSYCS